MMACHPTSISFSTCPLFVVVPWEFFSDLLRIRNRSFLGSGRARRPRMPFHWVGGEAAHLLEGSPGPPGPPRPQKWPITNHLRHNNHNFRTTGKGVVQDLEKNETCSKDCSTEVIVSGPGSKPPFLDHRKGGCPRFGETSNL